MGLVWLFVVGPMEKVNSAKTIYIGGSDGRNLEDLGRNGSRTWRKTGFMGMGGGGQKM